MGFLSKITKPFKSVIKSVGGPLGTMIGGWIGGPTGAAIGSAIGGGLQGQIGAEEQNSANKQAAQTQMDFQERMSNTSWQRGVADMRNAGINPILAYKMGGASTPIGAMPIMTNEAAAGLDGASQMTNSAVAAKTVGATINNINAQAYATKQSGKLHSSQYTAAQQAARVAPDMQDAVLGQQQAATQSAKAKADADVVSQKVQKKIAEYLIDNPHLMYLPQYTRVISGVLGNVGSARSLSPIPFK